MFLCNEPAPLGLASRGEAPRQKPETSEGLHYPSQVPQPGCKRLYSNPGPASNLMRFTIRVSISCCETELQGEKVVP